MFCIISFVQVSSSFAAQLLKMFDVCSIWDVGKTDAIVQAFSEVCINCSMNCSQKA